ncbi:MAG: metallophosphoesterase family protein [Anaerolineae bacterium]
MRFLHVADVHLGYQQYGSRERYNDFGRAFFHVVDQAVERKVDALLLAGDLFEKRTVDPKAMGQAVTGLQKLKDAGISVIAVEGNHERAHYQDQISWLEFLDSLGLLILLNAPISEGRLLLRPHTAEEVGAYTDLPGGVRIYGLRYYGASAARVFEMLRTAIESQAGPRPAFSLLLTHAGIEGVIPRCLGAVPLQALEPLRPFLNHVALGHIHKPYAIDGWIYNPGSLETWAADEAAWADRGFYQVEIDLLSPGAQAQARLVRTPRRRFERLRVAVDACPSPQAVYRAVESELRRVHLPEADAQPVLQITLEGSLAFDRAELDIARVEEMARQTLDPLLVRVHNATLPPEFDIGSHSPEASRAELEHRVLTELIERDTRYRPQSGAWAQVALEIKRLALGGQSPAAILDLLLHKRAELGAEGL